MAGNPATNGPATDSPHVVTATGTNGATPRDWDATDKTPAGRWKAVDGDSGEIDLSGNVTAAFPDVGRWKQT